MRKNIALIIVVALVFFALLAGCSTDKGSGTAKSEKMVKADSVVNKLTTSDSPEAQNKQTEVDWVLTEIQLFQKMESDFNTYNTLLNNPKNTSKWATDTNQATLQIETDIKSFQRHKPIGKQTATIYTSMSPALATAQKAMKQTELALHTGKTNDILKVNEYLNKAASQLTKANQAMMVIENKMLTKTAK
ncbi:DUF3558 domain-containing protein [Sporolactobacillus spathodeae]|uniref:Lipoprotein n=1 Tax=Sporolactobacillus spathodeae TaxID=1465502 RepID=A0ABS2QBW3_9BACL|nr:DUF3558 domain-containing protein [Sporolactobacillus spathodeae]MBM7658452.1 hypothetical protein [Sporolactobacillus spathodeae]